ncbi:hypothetical protein BDZ89DRAFT_1040615 [Hymenopellis radicata]|nr:hypothetical protein BDZ89DRAFT_1040615 [Hymenopellis radicata]
MRMGWGGGGGGSESGGSGDGGGDDSPGGSRIHITESRIHIPTFSHPSAVVVVRCGRGRGRGRRRVVMVVGSLSSVAAVIKTAAAHPAQSQITNPHPRGCLTIVRAAGATIVTPWVVVVVVVVVQKKEIPLDQTLTRRFGTRPGSPDRAG